MVAAGVELFEGEYEQRLVATDPAATAALPGGAGVVVLDTVVTPELEAEGVARDLVRVVQQARKDAALDVSDRITLTLELPDSVRSAVEPHLPFVQSETLTSSVVFGSGVSEGTVGDGLKVKVAVARV